MNQSSKRNYLVYFTFLTLILSDAKGDENLPKVYLDPDGRYDTLINSPTDIFITSLISGVKPMEIKWYHNGQKLQDQHNTSLIHINKGKLWLKAPILKFHEGRYTLEARNEFGYDDESVQIRVIQDDIVPGANPIDFEARFEEDLDVTRNHHNAAKASSVVTGCAVAIVAMIALGASLVVCKPRRIVKRTKEVKRRLLKKVTKKREDMEAENSTDSE